MIGHPFFLHLIEDPVLLFQPGDDPFHRFLQFRKPHLVLAAPHCQQGRLVDDIGQIGTGEPRRHCRDLLKIRVRTQRHLLGMDTQDGQAADLVRTVDDDVAIEPAGAQERGIENFRTVGRRHQDDADARIEPVHLDQQLIECLFAFLVGHRPHAPRFSQRIKLIDEDDAGRLQLRLFEKVAHARRPDPHEHFHELRPADAEERHPGLSGNRPGQ